jgi:hypothetical protein
MIVIHPAKSYVLMETVFDKQNDGKPLGERLKGGHFELMKTMVNLLKKEIGNYQVFGRKAGPDGYNLRSLRTNCVQLAKMLKCSVRTIRNRLGRLAGFQWIKKVFHGSNAAFEIYINLDLLHLQETTACHSNSVATIFANPLPSMRQFLPDTLSRVPRQDTKEENEYSGLPSGTDAPTTASAAPAPNGTQQQLDTLTGYHPSSETPAGKQQDTSTPSKKVPAKKVSPPAKLPKTMKAATAHLSDKDRARLPRLLDTVWEHALGELDEWLPGYLVGSEVIKGKIGLAEFFAYSNPERWKDAATEFIARVDLVTSWCERRTAAGKKAFIPLPSLWFDHRNPMGFAVSKAWYKTQQQQLKKAKIQSEINTCLKIYWRALESNGGDVDEAIRIIKQRLEKRGGPALFQLFTDKIQPAPSINLVA